ncbi:winged helix-turn-helix transcriptional regulator [Leuconostoc citreum]|uniref:winged helix-turn-helix transcriptional regulator n=1 Tax=Leuconostoc citreum TaxID=33964 RepID=UPI0039C98F23
MLDYLGLCPRNKAVRIFSIRANQLNELMADQIVSKREYLTGKVKHTEYQLTDIGETLIPIIVALNDWGENRLTQVTLVKTFNK